MSPLDDELRALLTARADAAAAVRRPAGRHRGPRRAAAPPPDGPGGRRHGARGRPRRGRRAGRWAAARATTPTAPDLAATSPSPAPPPVTSPSPTAVPGRACPLPVTDLVAVPDRARAPRRRSSAPPWTSPRRGPTAAPTLPTDFLASVRRELVVAARRQEVVALFGQVYEPSGRAEVVVLGRGGGAARWAVAAGHRRPARRSWPTRSCATGATALSAALAGDEPAGCSSSPRPTSSSSSTARTAARRSAAMAALGSGVATTAAGRRPDPRPGAGAGRPHAGARPGGSRPGDRTGRPRRRRPSTAAGSRAWLACPRRCVGAARPRDEAAGGARPPPSAEPDAQARLTVLFAGAGDGGQRFLVGQAWLVGGQTAHRSATPPGGDGRPAALPRAAATRRARPCSPTSCAAHPARRTDTLVVVPQPGTGQVLYGDDGATRVPPGRCRPGRAGRRRARRPRPAARATDRLRLLDGDGRTTVTDRRGAPLVCGLTELRLTRAAQRPA